MKLLYIILALLPLRILAAPLAPTDLVLVAHINSVEIRWSDNASDETGYKIYRDNNLIYTTVANVTTHFDLGLEANHTYTYTIKATDDQQRADFFPIGVYYLRGQKPIQSDTDDPNDPDYVPLDGDFRYNPTIAENEYLKEFQDLKSYGFNTAILMINPLVHPSSDEDRAKRVVNGLLNAAQNSSMQIVVPISKTTALLSENHELLSDEQIRDVLRLDYIDLFIASNSVFGYQVFDEPVPIGFDGVYGPAYKQVDPDQLGQVHNIITSLDTNAYAISTWNNIESMELLNDEMNPDSILVDLYPFALDAYNGEQADGDTPLGDLSDANPRGDEGGSFYGGVDQPTYTQWLQRTQAIAADKPVWVAIQAFGGDSYWRSPIAKELRLQVFSSIKNGAKGIFYFMYQSESWADGLMDMEYKETPLIKEAKEINKKVETLAPTLLRLTLTDNHATTSGAEVQTFTHKNGDKYLIVVNSDVIHSSTITILIEKSWFLNAKKATDIYTHDSFMISDENDQYLKVQLPIEAADGRVILLKD